MTKHTLNRLSDTKIRQVSKAGRVSDGGGLFLVVSASGSKSWVFMWVASGKRREMGLGSYPDVTLKSARDKAKKCRELVAEGGDPIAVRKRDKATTFREVAEAFIKSREDSWRNDKHKYQWRQTLGLDDGDVKRRIFYCSNLMDKPVADIKQADVMGALLPIWNTRPETAARVRGRIELVLDFAKTKEWRSGDNPARWKGYLENLLPKRKREDRAHLPAMPFKEIPAFMVSLRTRDAMAARALEFLILTAARTGEVIGATWDEIDLDSALWTVPRERMKGGKEHVVPLSTAAINLLRPLNENRLSKYVFPGNVTLKTEKRDGAPPLSNMALEMLLRRMGIENATVHGFRSGFRDWCGDETDFPREVAEAALAHKVGNSVEQAYRRGSALEKRRKLMELWASYCGGAATVVKVFPFRA